MRKIRYCTGVLVFVALALTGTLGSAVASDFSHECRTADGSFVIFDEALYAAGAQNRAIPYTVLKRTVLSHTKGYCLSNASPDRGRRYGHEHKKYVLRIRFRHAGQRFTTDAICELASDGLPAAYNCDRRVVLRGDRQGGGNSGGTSSSGGGATGGTATRWDHNGSIMRLEADGARRRFVYVTPRRGMRRVGVRRGTLLFDGHRDGFVYEGTARIFNKRCGQFTYRVRGEVSDDARRVVLFGRAPRVGSDCQIRGRRDDRLEFDLLP